MHSAQLGARVSSALSAAHEFNLVNDHIHHEALDQTLLESQNPLIFSCQWVKFMTVDGMVLNLEIRTDKERE